MKHLRTVLDRHSKFIRAASVIALTAALGACASSHPNADLASASAGRDRSSTVLSMAEAAAARGDHNAAIPLFRRASGNRAQLGMARSLAAIGEYAAAEQAFRSALDGDEGAAYRGLAQVQLILGQYSEAIANFSRAVRNEPNDPANYSGLGVAFDAAGQHGEAVDVYRRAMAQFPGHRALSGNYGLSLVLHGDTAEGVRRLEDAVRAQGAGARERQNLAIAYAIAGDYDRAAAMAALDLDVQGVRSNLMYAATLKGMNEADRMRAMIAGAARDKTDIAAPANRRESRDVALIEASVARILPASVADAAPGDNPVLAGAPVEDRGDTPVVDPAVLAGAPPLLEPEGWAVQIAAYRRLEHLTPGWNYLSGKYASIIGGLEPRRSEVDHPPSEKGPSGFFYRLNAGPLTSRLEAEGICQAMMAKGGECWVRAPEPAEGQLPDSRAEEMLVGSADHEAVVGYFASQVIAAESAPTETQVAAAPTEAPVAPAPEPEAITAPAPRLMSAETLMVSLPALPQPPAQAPAVDLVSAEALMASLPAMPAPALPVETAEAAVEATPQPVVFTPRNIVVPQLELTNGFAVDLPPLPDFKPPVKESGDADEAETLPTTFGATGVTKVNAPANNGAQAISAFEEAEAWQVQKDTPLAPALTPETLFEGGLKATGTLESSGQPLPAFDKAGQPVPEDD